MDGSPPGSTIPGILQTRTPEWVAISFSNAWKWKVKVKSLSCVRLLATPWTTAYQAPPSMGFSKQEYWSGVPLPSPPPQAATNLLSTSINIFFLLDSTHKWDHTVFVFSWLILLSLMQSRYIHVVANGRIFFFFWMNNILRVCVSVCVCLCITFSLSMYLPFGA